MLKQHLRKLVRDFMFGVGTAFALFGVAAMLGLMFRIFRWAAGL